MILDMNLSDGLGMDIIKPLRQLSPAVLIVVFTIDVNPIYRQVCLAGGANWFFEKATETDVMLEVVRELSALEPLFPFNQGALNA